MMGAKILNALLFRNFKWKNTIFTLVFFLLMSMFGCVYLIKANFIYGAFDTTFHFQRVYNLVENIRHGNLFPTINTYSFSQLGSGVTTFYPNLPVYYFALLYLLSSSWLISYKVFIVTTIFISMVSSYYAYKVVLGKDKEIGPFIFALSYSLTNLMITYIYRTLDFGESWSTIFFPLAFAGFYVWLKRGDYRLLTLSMIWIIFSHTLNSLLILIYMAILTIVNIRLVINKRKIINLLKAIIITLGCTSFFWVNFFSNVI
ncbi:MAG: hypothetical protein Q3959_03510 [Limosilactobacillus sp.]|uniref:hypothetical protein n=1 Tax=Limosilactobacillus sp. TaxID=2773925 RepID=UPI0026FDA18A|nr:hypothetical protein [Limosilactobacillus sp.]